MARIHINRDRRNLGEFTPEQVAEGLASGRFLAADLAWREGMETWKPLSTFDDLPAVAPEIEPPLTEDIVPALPPASPEAEPEGVPWSRRREIGFLSACWETIAQTLGRPTALFARLPDAPPLADPFRFYLLFSFATGLLNAALTVVFAKFAIDWITSVPELASNPEVAKSLVYLRRITFGEMVFGLALMIPLAPFVSAALLHGLLALFSGAKQSFLKTFAVTCYVYGAVSPLQLLLCFGFIVQFVWSVVSLILGLASAHRTDKLRAGLAVGVAFLIYCGFYVLLNIGAASLPAAGL